MKTLHILNGDSTAFIFRETGINGDILIWRELLSEGPVSKTDLWQLRSEWICGHFNEQPAQYHHKVIEEVKRLQNLDNYNEVILWFEYDLVCQINLIYILSVLNETISSTFPIYLICPEKIDGMPNFRGLGELNASQFLKLYVSKFRLQKEDLEFATEAWNVYVKDDKEQISTFLNRNFGNLTLLKNALLAHLLRFPKKSNNLNHIEETLLDIINTGIETRPELYETFWSREPIFGITGLQLDFVLDNLKSKGLVTI